MQNYMQYAAKTRNRESAPQTRAYETKSVSTKTNTLLKHPRPVMKPIFDSDYVKPEENPKVVKDDSVRKSMAFAAALKSFEESLTKNKDALN